MTAGFGKQISKHLTNTTAMLFSDHLGPFGSFSFREIRKTNQRIGREIICINIQLVMYTGLTHGNQGRKRQPDI